MDMQSLVPTTECNEASTALGKAVHGQQLGDHRRVESGRYVRRCSTIARFMIVAGAMLLWNIVFNNSLPESLSDLFDIQIGREVLASNGAQSLVGASTIEAEEGGSNMSIGSTVFTDANDNGQLDAGEAGIPNVSVNLYNVSNTLVATSTTDIDGNYYITGLVVGNYYIIIQDPPISSPASSTTANVNDDQVDDDNNGDQPGGPGAPVISPIINLAIGAEPIDESGPGGDQDDANDSNGDMTIDFGFVPALSNVSVSGRVWDDMDQDGIRATDESGLANITVALYDTNTGLPVVDGSSNSITTTTDTSGIYLFDSLSPGNYYIILRNLPDGYQATTQNAGTDDAVDSDLYMNVPQTTPTGPLFDGDQYENLDAGLFDEDAGALVTIGDRIWYDHDGDGIQGTDVNEYGLANIPVTLYNVNNAEPFAITSSDTDGNYSFTRVPAGQYYLEFDLLNEFLVPVWQTRGADIGLDSNINRDRRTPVLTLTGGEETTEVDAGFSLAASLEVNFWDDANQNGIREDGEAGIAGALVTLLDESGDSLMSISTEETGAGSFVVPPGTYQLRFTPPDGYVFSPDQVGGGIDNDASSDGLTQVISLFPSDTETGWNAGAYRLGPSSLDEGNEPSKTLTWLYLPLLQ